MPTHSTIFFPGLSILLFSFINKVLTVKGYFISSLYTIISITISISVSIYMLFAGWEVRIVKNCDRGLENTARGRRPRAAFSRPRSQFFTIRTDP